MEKARAAGQAISKNAAPGTFASGVQKVTDVLPSLMTDLVQSAPDNQKEKISKLLDIWERGQTFPLNMLAGFKQQLSSPKNSKPNCLRCFIDLSLGRSSNTRFLDTHTPPGSPPKGASASNAAAAGNTANPQIVAPSAPVVPPDAGSLLAALATLGQQNGQANPTSVAPPQASFPQSIAPPPPPGFLPPPPVAANGQAFPPPPPGNNEVVQQILGAIMSGQIPADQAMTVLAVLAQNQQPGSVPIVPPPPQLPVTANSQPVAQNNAQSDRFEQNGNRYRDRSRSPDYNRRRQSPRRSPPNRRDSPTYGAYDPNAGAESNVQNRNDRERGRGRGRNRGRGRDEYRQRTPPAERRQPAPGEHLPNTQPKFLEWDHSMPRDHIRVLSRTLFVGGAGGTEGEIRNIFSRFGKVQTCIVNQDKRHAFVKMVNRQFAVAAKEGMDNIQDPNALSKARQVRLMEIHDSSNH